MRREKRHFPYSAEDNLYPAGEGGTGLKSGGFIAMADLFFTL
jgi:hypothetical protein